MSNLIYEGDIIANFGRYLPTPYIFSILIGEVDTGDARMTVNLNVNVDASIFTDDITLEEQIKKLNFYWMWSDTLLEDNQFVFDLVRDDGSNIFLIDKDAMLNSQTLLYDSEGNRIIKYIMAEGDNVFPAGDTWGDLSNLYVYAFSTSEDLTEDYWNPVAPGYPVAIDDHWEEFLKTEISDIAYEQVMDGGSIPDPTETIWVDANDAAYADVPLQAITSLYYKSNKITHEEIVESFQDLVAEYQEQSETDSHLKDVLDNISYLLEIYGNDVELLPKLNEFRRAFPSKTSATTPGQVYLKYRKKIYTANSVIELDEQVYKKVVSNSKIIDDREYGFTSFEGIDTSEVCGESGCTDPCELVSNFTFDRQLLHYHTTVGVGAGTLGSAEMVGANYGFFFFDYEKAQTFTSNAAILGSMDINKVKEIWGEGVFNLGYQLSEVKLERQYTTLSVDPFGTLIEMAGALTPLIDMVAKYNYDEGYPELQYVEHTYYGDTDVVGYYEYAQSFEVDFDTSGMTLEEAKDVAGRQLSECTAKSFLVLRNFDLVPETSGADSALGDYGLMCFEFQDLMGEDVQRIDEVGTSTRLEYIATVTIEDNTLEIFQAIIDVFGTFSTDFQAYYDAATEACAYSSVDGVFNDYFITWATEEWPDLATSPWVMAAAVYYLYLDLLEGTFDGDMDLIALATQTMASAISPTTGTLTQLQIFYEAFVALTGLVNDIETEESFPEGYEISKEFTCTQDIGEVPVYENPEGTMCDLVHTEEWETDEPEEKPAPESAGPDEWVLVDRFDDKIGWAWNSLTDGLSIWNKFKNEFGWDLSIWSEVDTFFEDPDDAYWNIFQPLIKEFFQAGEDAEKSLTLPAFTSESLRFYVPRGFDIDTLEDRNPSEKYVVTGLAWNTGNCTLYFSRYKWTTPDGSWQEMTDAETADLDPGDLDDEGNSVFFGSEDAGGSGATVYWEKPTEEVDIGVGGDG